MQTLDEVIARSVGARLISYTFESKELRFQLYLEGDGHLLAVAVRTDTVHGRSVSADPERSRCRIEVLELARYLPTLRGRYAPAPDVERFVDLARDRLTLALGRRASEFRHLLLLRGQYPLLACLVAERGDIRWSVE